MKSQVMLCDRWRSKKIRLSSHDGQKKASTSQVSISCQMVFNQKSICLFCNFTSIDDEVYQCCCQLRRKWSTHTYCDEVYRWIDDFILKPVKLFLSGYFVSTTLEENVLICFRHFLAIPLDSHTFQRWFHIKCRSNKRVVYES